MSSTPASWRRRLTAGDATRPVPRGAGMSWDCQFSPQISSSGFTYTNRDGTALAGLLRWQRVRKTQVCTPVTSSDRQNAQLGDDDSGADGSCDFLRCLDTKTNVSLRITNNNDGLESSTLTGTSLLLDGLNL
jgi:hypothetical protein